MTLGELIKEYRMKTGLSQDVIAEKTGLSKAYISILERNENPKNGLPPTPSIKTVNAVAMAIELGFDEVFNLLDADLKVSLHEQLPPERPAVHAPTPPRSPFLSDEVIKIATQYSMATEHEQSIVRTVLAPYASRIRFGTLDDLAELVMGKPQKLTEIRLYTQPSAAGLGFYHDNDSYDMVEFPNVPERANIAVRIVGDSMEPDYLDGDIVFVQTESVLTDGEVGVFNYDGSGYLKKLRLKPPRLVSLNPEYPDMHLREGMAFHTIGRVLGIHRDK